MAAAVKDEVEIRPYTLLVGQAHIGGKSYTRGQVVQSSKDLVKKYGANKFAYGDQATPRRRLGDDGLAGLEVEKLREFADAESIDVAGVADDDLLAAIRRSLYGL